MGKIKGWEKSGKLSWYNYASVDESPPPYIYANVIYDEEIGWSAMVGEHGGADRLYKTNLTKTQAIKYVMKYMRSHPNG